MSLKKRNRIETEGSPLHLFTARFPQGLLPSSGPCEPRIKRFITEMTRSRVLEKENQMSKSPESGLVHFHSARKRENSILDNKFSLKTPPLWGMRRATECLSKTKKLLLAIHVPSLPGSSISHKAIFVSRLEPNIRQGLGALRKKLQELLDTSSSRNVFDLNLSPVSESVGFYQPVTILFLSDAINLKRIDRARWLASDLRSDLATSVRKAAFASPELSKASKQSPNLEEKTLNFLPKTKLGWLGRTSDKASICLTPKITGSKKTNGFNQNIAAIFQMKRTPVIPKPDAPNWTFSKEMENELVIKLFPSLVKLLPVKIQSKETLPISEPSQSSQSENSSLENSAVWTEKFDKPGRSVLEQQKQNVYKHFILENELMSIEHQISHKSRKLEKMNNRSEELISMLNKLTKSKTYRISPERRIPSSKQLIIDPMLQPARSAFNLKRISHPSASFLIRLLEVPEFETANNIR